jgi:hypothetical protein
MNLQNNTSSQTLKLKIRSSNFRMQSCEGDVLSNDEMFIG